MGADIVSFTPPDELPIAAEPQTSPDAEIRDGVQRRLMNALINLQRADECLDHEPDRARELIREALGYANVEPAELRDVAAGIHPTALATHGLAAAVSTLAQASAVPMTLDISASRCSRHVEAAAYFLIADALTNVSERANATRLHVAAYRAATDLIVELCDDGAAGADHDPDAVAGLRACVEALDGTLQILRQEGIGTRIRASFPNADDAVPS
jgi:signal transduction histidine kinase